MPERQVIFYACQDYKRLPAFDRIAAVKDINDLSDADWRVADSAMETGVIVERVGNARSATRLQYLRIRDDAPHLLTRARQLSLFAPPAGDLLSEFTYVVIWPDKYMAAVSSRDAPGHKKLASYFHATSGERTNIVNLYRPDVVERLKELRRGGLRSVQVKVQASRLQQVEDDERISTFKQIFNAGRGTDAATIEVDLNVSREKDARLSDEVGKETQALAGMVDILDKLIVVGQDSDGQRDEINMKKERIAVAIDYSQTAAVSGVFRKVEDARKEVERVYGSLDRCARGQ